MPYLQDWHHGTFYAWCGIYFSSLGKLSHTWSPKIKITGCLTCICLWHKIVIVNSQKTQNVYFMSNLLYAIAVILIIAWLLGFFVYNLGAVIHILLVIAIVAVLLRLIRGERV